MNLKDAKIMSINDASIDFGKQTTTDQQKYFTFREHRFHDFKNEFCQRHINSVEQISAESSLKDLTLACGDFNLTSVAWICREGALCPSNVTAARETIIFDFMVDCILFEPD
jgi:hypothetical protein